MKYYKIRVIKAVGSDLKVGQEFVIPEKHLKAFNIEVNGVMYGSSRFKIIKQIK